MVSKSSFRISQRKSHGRLASKLVPRQEQGAPDERSAAAIQKTSFTVDSVTPATEAMPTETLGQSIAFRLQRNILALPDAGQLVIDQFPAPRVPVEIRTPPGILKFIPERSPRRLSHPLIDAVHMAFSQHRPLTLSPDAIWLVIAQGFGHHVAQNSEELRASLVTHEGKKILTESVTDLSLESFQSAVRRFSQRIKVETNPVLHETLICNFSTTSADIRTASEVALMDTFSTYFTYALMCICGIPTITIEGTSEDWHQIRARVEVLATYGLEWWVARLRPILDEFTRTAEGRPSPDFWMAIYKPKKAYAAEIVTGWIADLFPYLGDAPRRRRNHVFDRERCDWVIPADQGVSLNPFQMHDFGVDSRLFPSGISSARLDLTLPDNTPKQVDLIGGFLAVKQDDADLSLAPVIGWCVAELPPQKPVTVSPV